MNTMRLFPLELSRLLQSRPTWLIITLTVLSPVAGLVHYKRTASATMLSVYLANPAIAGGVAGAICFGLLTVFELDRACRSRVDVLMNTVVSPLTTALTRLLALMTAAVLTMVLTMLIWLPVSAGLIGSVFSSMNYGLAYLLFMGLALPLGILAAASAFQFTCRADLSIVLFIALCALSLTVWAYDWQLCWLNPCVWALSDDFSNFRIFRSVAWMRLTWLTALAGIWTVSYLCIRQYGKGILGSLARNVRRIYRPAIAFLLLSCSGIAYTTQPFIDHSNPDLTVMSFDKLPDAKGVTFLSRSAQVFPDTAAGTVTGRASYRFENVSGQEQRIFFGINPGYAISNVQADGADVPFTVDSCQEYNEALLEVTIPSREETELTMEYSGFPQESMPAMQGSKELSSEYLCLENAALSPRVINVMPGSAGYPAEIEITLPSSMIAIPFGSSEAQVVAENDDGTRTWRYEHNGAGGILYAGDYIRQDIEAEEMNIAFFYGRRHQDVMEATRAADAVKEVADYCTRHYGTLPFGTGKTLKLIQSRVTGGGYAANGASLLDESDFTANNLENAHKGGAPGEVMIHELVHQWWGLGNMFDTSDSASPWSAEGLTVYTTYRIVKELYGETYAREHYIDQWRQAVDDYYLNFYVRNPHYLANLPEEKQLEITGSLTYVRQYCEMPLKILKAEQLTGGEDAFDQILNHLFNREPDPMYPYLTYQDFLEACGLNEEDLNLD